MVGCSDIDWGEPLGAASAPQRSAVAKEACERFGRERIFREDDGFQVLTSQKFDVAVLLPPPQQT
jgi:hypothetical protein